MELNTNGQESEIIKNIDNTPSKECSSELKKSCLHCHTTTTPCWRVGPAGPKTLCNACGIRYRKRRRAVLGLDKGGAGRSSRKIGESGGRKLGISSLKLGLMVAGGRYMLLEEEWKRKKQKKKLGEEEQAAILLMALSCSC